MIAWWIAYLKFWIIQKLTEHYNTVIETSKEKATKVQTNVITKIEAESDSVARLKSKWTETWQKAKSPGKKLANNLANQRK